MRKWRFITTAGMFVAIAGSIIAHQRQQPEQPKGFRLEDHTWPEAETLLRPETVVVIPLGAAASEHGPHLKLRNDVALAEYFASLPLFVETVLCPAAADVVQTAGHSRRRMTCASIIAR